MIPSGPEVLQREVVLKQEVTAKESQDKIIQENQ